MLNTFRSIAHHTFSKILLVLLVLSFVAWGVGDMLRQGGIGGGIATVGGEAITAQNFMRDYERERANMQQMLGAQATPELIRQMNLPIQTLQRLINQRVLAQGARRFGLVVPDAVVASEIRTNPAFKNKSGAFDKELYLATLRNSGLSEKQYADALREEKATGWLLETVSAVAPVPEAGLQAVYLARNEKRAIDLVRIPDSLAEVPAPSAEEREQYYAVHKNAFIAPETRDISYLVFTPDLVKTELLTAEQLQQAYDERIDEFRQPEKRQVSQLLYATEEEAKKAYEALQQNQTLAQVAKTVKPTNKELSLGTIQQQELLEDTGEKVFALKTGEFTPPLKTAFGWHVFVVDKIQPAHVQTLAEATPALEKDLKANAAEAAYSRLATEMEDALAGGASLKEVAAQAHAKLVDVAGIDREGADASGKKAANLPEEARVLETAFKLEENADSGLISGKGGTAYIVHVNRITPEQARPLAEVSAQVDKAWRKDETQRRLGALAKDIGEALADPAKRGEAMAKYSLTTQRLTTTRAQPDKRMPMGLVAEAFGLQKGQATGAQVTDDGFAVAIVADIIPAKAPDPKDKALDEIRKQMEGQMKSEMIQQLVAALRNNTRISVNQAALEALTQ